MTWLMGNRMNPMTGLVWAQHPCCQDKSCSNNGDFPLLPKAVVRTTDAHCSNQCGRGELRCGKTECHNMTDKLSKAARPAGQIGQLGIEQKHACLKERVVGGASPGWGQQLPHHAAHGCVQPIPAKGMQCVVCTISVMCFSETRGCVNLCRCQLVANWLVWLEGAQEDVVDKQIKQAWMLSKGEQPDKQADRCTIVRGTGMHTGTQ